MTLQRADTTLGFDTSTSELTVAVVSGDEVLAEREAGPDGSGRPRHARELLGAIEAALAEAGGWSRVSAIVVGIGPGTFTGLRIGIATARALAQSRSLPLTGVSSLSALAAGRTGTPTLAVLDAKRREVFAALYDAGGAELWPPWVGPPAELGGRVRELSDAALVAVGEGSVRFRDELEAAGAMVPGDGDSAHRLRARHVCRLAAKAGPQRSEQIQPTYLRRPDAELWRERDRRPKTGG